MSATVATLLGSAGAVAAPLAVLVPLLLAQGRRVDARFEALTADVGEVRRDLHALAERVARIEGCHERTVAPARERHPGAQHGPGGDAMSDRKAACEGGKRWFAIRCWSTGARTAEIPGCAGCGLLPACLRCRPMPVPPPWALDIETIVGVAITLLAVLVPVMVSRHCTRRRNPAVLPSPWRPSGPGGPAPRESDAA